MKRPAQMFLLSQSISLDTCCKIYLYIYYFTVFVVLPAPLKEEPWQGGTILHYKKQNDS